MNTKKEDVYKNLRYRIITQDLSPGQILNEKPLMEHYGIGRTPLREILLELKKDGLVQILPRSGTMVAPLDLHEFRQVVEIRSDLEGLVGELAAQRISPEQLDRLHEILAKVEKLREDADRNAKQLLQCESEFHSIVFEATANPKLVAILQELQGVCARFWHYLVFDKQELLAQLDDQAQMFKALQAGDPQAAREIMQQHILNFSNHVGEKILGK